MPTRLNKDYLEEVWTLFFESAVASALKYRPLRYVAWCITEPWGSEFGGHSHDFRTTLDALFEGSIADADFKPPNGADRKRKTDGS